MAEIKQFSKEMYDMMDFFERSIEKTVKYIPGTEKFKKECKDNWKRGYYYTNGDTNSFFLAFMTGYNFGKTIGSQELDKRDLIKIGETTLDIEIDEIGRAWPVAEDSITDLIMPSDAAKLIGTDDCCEIEVFVMRKDK